MGEATISTGQDERALPGAARAALVFFLLAGTYVRVAGTWRQVLGGDETHAHEYVMSGYGYILSHFDVVASPIGPTLLQRLALDAFGASVFSYRLPAILAGLIGLWLLYPLGWRLVGRGPAWLATMLLAVHPLHVYYSRFARSYTLVFLLALVLVFALVRALEGRRGCWIGAGLAAALLPWMHLSTAATVASLAVIGVASAWRLRPGTAFRRSLVTFGSAGALCLALFAPAAETLIDSLKWLAAQRGTGEASFPAVLAMLGGSAVGGWSMAIGSSAAGIQLARERGPIGAIFLTALLVPAITTWLADTPAISISYARYQFVSLVPLLLGSAWLLFGVLSRFPVLRGGPSYAFGIVLVSLQTFWSPIPVSDLFGAFSLNAEFWRFTREEPAPPFIGTPEIYHQLARSQRVRVVEYPVFPAYTRVLLANYESQHRQHTLVGLTSGIEGVYTRRPYVSLRELDPRDTDVDWVIVHKDLKRESREFFERAWPGRVPLRTSNAPEDVRSFQKAWGEPAFEDEYVQAWRFERP